MENFLNHYKRYKPGTEHRLLICYKNLSIEQISKFRKKLKKIKHEEFLDRVKKMILILELLKEWRKNTRII